MLSDSSWDLLRVWARDRLYVSSIEGVERYLILCFILEIMVEGEYTGNVFASEGTIFAFMRLTLSKNSLYFSPIRDALGICKSNNDY